MVKIEAFPESEVKDIDINPYRVRRRVRGKVKEFVPDWVLTIVFSVVWGFILTAFLVVTASNIVSGMISGITFVLAAVIALLMFPTYSPSYRTVLWSIAISSTCAYAATYFSLDNLLIILVPTAIFIALRVNMNGRKLWSLMRD